MRRPARSMFTAHLALLTAAWLAIVVPTSTSVGGVERASAPPLESPVTGLTAPKRQAIIGSLQEGRLRSVLVTEGDYVDAGATLFVLDDSVQRASTEIAEARAESLIEVDLAKAQWEHAQKERDWWEKLRGDERASSKELTDAVAVERIRDLEYRLAVFTREQAYRGAEMQRRLLDQFRAVAPFSGYVVGVHRKEAESVDRLEPVVTLAQLDPLEVNFDCPIGAAGSVRQMQTICVQTTEPVPAAREARITYVGRIADAASQTFRLRAEVDNGIEPWLAGVKVVIDWSGGACHAAALDEPPPGDVTPPMNP